MAFLQAKATAALTAMRQGADAKAPITVHEEAEEAGSQGRNDGGSDVGMEEEEEEEFADEDFWQGLGMGAGDVEPVEAVIPEANKTAAQLREEEVERDVEETDRLEQEFLRVFGAYKNKARSIEWKEEKVCHPVCLNTHTCA